MKFIISRQELSELVGKVQNAVSPKAPIPVLGNILLEAEEDRIILTATDLKVMVRCTGHAKVFEPGATTVPARRFAQLIRELTASHLQISTNGRDVTEIVADSSTFKLLGMPKAEFPGIADFSEAGKVVLKQRELYELLTSTSFAVSKDESRHPLTGVHMLIQQGHVIFIGTDGKRLARAYFPVAAHKEFHADCIIPVKAIDEICKNLTDAEESCTISITDDKVAVDAGAIFIVAKLLTGDFPDVDRIIPQRSQAVVALHREELSALLRQIALFTSEGSHSVRFSFRAGELELTANTHDIGEAKVSMPVHYTGERFDIAFNPLFVLDILRHCKNESVAIGLSDPFNPAVMVDGELAQSIEVMPTPLFLNMPLRLNEE